MNSGDSIKVSSQNSAIHGRKHISLSEISVNHQDDTTYTHTYYPTLLIRDIDHGFYSVANEAIQSILPSSIMKKVNFETNPDVLKFRFFQYEGVAFYPNHVQSIDSETVNSSEVKDQTFLTDSINAKEDTLSTVPAIDSLPSGIVNVKSFSLNDIDSSLYSRFGLNEYISKDSYILLESHPELVYGKFSQKVQVVNALKVGEPKIRETQNLGITSFSMLTLGLIFLVVSLKYQFKNVIAIGQSLLSMHEAQKTYQSRSLSFKRFTTLSSFFYVLTLTVFSVLIAQKFAGKFVHNFGILLTYCLFLLVIFVLYFGKILSMSIIANISRQKELFDELKFTHQVFYTTLATIIFPFLIVSSYADIRVSNIFIYISIYLAIILLLLYFIRSLRLFLNYRVSFFFWFLYFCTLEILPIAIGLYLLE